MGSELPNNGGLVESADVLIIGAGLSGVGAACTLRQRFPDKSVVILESRDSLGGTWDLFRYPGVRSDSDMFTLGYRFLPWTEAEAIADGESILRYINTAADKFGVRPLIRYRHHVISASWSSEAARWTVTAEDTSTGERRVFSTTFLYACTGYYRYDEGYSPKFPGMDEFTGDIVHPQQWPADLDYDGKRVVVIGSGATAVTLVPTLAKQAAHVTMLQRSPTYIAALPARDWIADKLRAILPESIAYPVVRWKNVVLSMTIFTLSRRRPGLVKSVLRRAAARQLPRDFDVDTHLKPTYQPWDQRMCLVPDGDLFAAISSRRATIVTEHIDTFTPTGIKLRSGDHLPADIIVSATGLNLLVVGGIKLDVDGSPVDVSDTVSYKGFMLSGVPNFVWTVGYTNASWTLKADLVADYTCRLLAHMEENGFGVVTPRRPTVVADTPLLDLTAGYVLRSLDSIPRQGDHAPWRLHQNYLRDFAMLRRGPVDDGVEFTRRSVNHATTYGYPMPLWGFMARVPDVANDTEGVQHD